MVNQVCPWGPLFTYAATAPCSPVKSLVRISPLEMLSTVTPSSLVQSPIVRENVQMTSSLASRSWIAVPQSIWICKVQPHLLYGSTLARIPVHFRGIPRGLPGPLPALVLTLGLQSQQSNAMQVNARILALEGRKLLLRSITECPPPPPPLPLCTNKVTPQCMYLSHLIETLWQPDNILPSPNYDCLRTRYHPFPCGDSHIKWSSMCCKFLRNLLVSCQCPDGPSSGSPVDTQNPGYK